MTQPPSHRTYGHRPPQPTRGTDVLRPIEWHEVQHLHRMGDWLASLRQTAGLSQRRLATLAGLNRVSIARIETGQRRTRRSTLTRIAVALSATCPELGSPDALVGELARLAGRALAPESAWTTSPPPPRA
jgi:DNA-binding XRE family transcriptional regulator